MKFTKELGMTVTALAVGVAVWNVRTIRRDDGCEARAQRDAPAIACRLEAFTPEERRAHENETRRLVGLLEDKHELADGWELRFAPPLLADVSRWFVEERKCCPFLSLTLTLPSEAGAAAARIVGPAGAKEILRPVLLEH